ncbi:MAG TPA: CGNR zinc finger domain-containing protein [Dermatophilaceae bacterium]|nr:CGNR zinc finger domain-containing protein [Dermatophilaceae bacterium]
MVFAHDTEVSLTSAAVVVNTWPGRHPGAAEGLPDRAALDELVRRLQWTGSRTHTAQELEAVRALRPRLAEVWTAGEDRAVEIVNGLLRENRALPQLVKHDQWDYHLHATPAEAPLAARMAVEAALALVDVIRMGELDRLRICEGADCGDVLVDLSKNRSRRYCDGGCGNRANVAAYRARKRTPVEGATAVRATSAVGSGR